MVVKRHCYTIAYEDTPSLVTDGARAAQVSGRGRETKVRIRGRKLDTLGVLCAGVSCDQRQWYNYGMDPDEKALLERFAELERAVAAMNGWWSGRVLRGGVYALPVLTERSVPDVLDVETTLGEAAIDSAARAFRQFRLLDIQDAGTAFRLPGWLIVDAEELAPVHAVNAHKESLRAAIRELAEEAPDRERLCRRLFPGCSMNQIYRRIVTVEERLEAVRFTWSPTTVSTTRLAPADVYATLEKRLAEALAANRTEWVQALEIARRRVASLPSSSVVLRRRPVAPHPRATLFVTRGRGAKKSMIHANLPVMLTRHSADLTVSDLRGFDRDRRRRQRSDKRVLEPILEGLHLYVERVPGA